MLKLLACLVTTPVPLAVLPLPPLTLAPEFLIALSSPATRPPEAVRVIRQLQNIALAKLRRALAKREKPIVRRDPIQLSGCA